MYANGQCLAPQTGRTQWSISQEIQFLQSVNLVALLEQELCQIRSILTSDTCDVIPALAWRSVRLRPPGQRPVGSTRHATRGQKERACRADIQASRPNSGSDGDSPVIKATLRLRYSSGDKRVEFPKGSIAGAMVTDKLDLCADLAASRGVLPVWRSADIVLKEVEG